MMQHRVFISHSSKDAQTANGICHYLEEGGILTSPTGLQPLWAASEKAMCSW